MDINPNYYDEGRLHEGDLVAFFDGEGCVVSIVNSIEDWRAKGTICVAWGDCLREVLLTEILGATQNQLTAGAGRCVGKRYATFEEAFDALVPFLKAGTP